MIPTKNALTAPQAAALDKLTTVWQSPYELQCSMTTLDALVRKGVAERRRELGASFYPRIGTEYRRLARSEEGEE